MTPFLEDVSLLDGIIKIVNQTCLLDGYAMPYDGDKTNKTELKRTAIQQTTATRFTIVAFLVLLEN